MTKLTPLESQTMELLVEKDERDRELAPLLDVAPRTVTHRILQVCNKLGVNTRVRAAVLYDRMRQKTT